jgi:1-acyl-sn-glycerol-3-phosphate acyltransferase
MIIRKILNNAGKLVMKACTKLMLGMDISRHASFPKGAKILVSNHPTTTDPFVLTGISSGTSAVLIKGSLFSIPFFGRYLRWSGHIPVYENRGAEAFKNALKWLNKGLTVIVFIDGDLSSMVKKLKKPKTGAVRLALSSGAPIIPIGISVQKKRIKNIKMIIQGLEDWSRWYFHGPYAVTIGRPIIFRGLIENRIKVKRQTNWLNKKIQLLVQESKLRILRGQLN